MYLCRYVKNTERQTFDATKIDSMTDRQTNKRLDGQTDRQTDKATIHRYTTGGSGAVTEVKV